MKSGGPDVEEKWFAWDLRAMYVWAVVSPNILTTGLWLFPLYLFVADV